MDSCNRRLWIAHSIVHLAVCACQDERVFEDDTSEWGSDVETEVHGAPVAGLGLGPFEATIRGVDQSPPV